MASKEGCEDEATFLAWSSPRTAVLAGGGCGVLLQFIATCGLAWSFVASLAQAQRTVRGYNMLAVSNQESVTNKGSHGEHQRSPWGMQKGLMGNVEGAHEACKKSS